MDMYYILLVILNPKPVETNSLDREDVIDSLDDKY